MASSRWFRKQKARSVSDPMEDSLWCGIPMCRVTPPQIMELTICYVINKLISAERHIVGFKVIILKYYGCMKAASFKLL